MILMSVGKNEKYRLINKKWGNCMDLYHSWIYINIVNTKWFAWLIVYLVIAFSFLGPYLIWFVINGKELGITKKAGNFMGKGKK